MTKAPFLVLLLLLVFSGSARGGHVFYYHAFGAWAVTCDRDFNDGRRSCSMATPVPSLAMPRANVTITEEAPETFLVKVRVTGHLDVVQPFLLGVDTTPPVPAKPERWGEARWTGAQASGLVQAMGGGSRLLLSFAPQGGPAQVETFLLTGFGEALAAMRHNLRAPGILPGRG